MGLPDHSRRLPVGTDRFSGEYKDFRQTLGLRPGTADHGAAYSYVLLTGLEAAIANKMGDGALEQLKRLRHGSNGEAVRALQQKLGTTVDGKFRAKLTKTLADYQKKQLGWADGVYDPEMDSLLKFDIFAPATLVVASREVPAPLAAAPIPEAEARDQIKLGTVCDMWDYASRSVQADYGRVAGRGAPSPPTSSASSTSMPMVPHAPTIPGTTVRLRTRANLSTGSSISAARIGTASRARAGPSGLHPASSSLPRR